MDVGFGNTKFVTGIGGGTGSEIRCASFPSRAFPSTRDPSKALGSEGRKTFAIPIGGLFYEVGPDWDGLLPHEIKFHCKSTTWAAFGGGKRPPETSLDVLHLKREVTLPLESVSHNRVTNWLAWVEPQASFARTESG